jgi:hypothetical protein
VRFNRSLVLRSAGVAAIIAVITSVMMSYQLGWLELLVLTALSAGVITLILRKT